MDDKQIWSRILDIVRPTVGHERTESFLEPCRVVSFVDTVLHVDAVNAVMRDWIVDNYQVQLDGALTATLGLQCRVEIHTAAEESADQPTPRAPQLAEQGTPRSHGVQSRYRFESFVVGACNQFAHAAAAAVADAPARQYNPLFIYGATGLGKTHLLHAIANHVLATHPDSRVVYVTAEAFMQEMIECLRYSRMEEFRSKYRSRATVLLVDDIQFLSGKDRTQEEFFHTFNALQTSGRQIILTSDVTPREIEKLEPRLRTRFEGGLLADMQAPDRETLRAILSAKAENLGLHVPSDLSEAVCAAVAGNIRELEGVLNRLLALQALLHQPVTLEIARQRIPEILHAPKVDVSVAAIIESTAKYHNLRSADLTGKGRTKQLAVPRHIAMFLARRHTDLSFPELGREFGGRDHSTIQHGVRKVESDLATDADLAYKIRLIETGLGIKS